MIEEGMITIPRKGYEKLKIQADVDLLKQLLESFKDIKEGKIRKSSWINC